MKTLAEELGAWRVWENLSSVDAEYRREQRAFHEQEGFVVSLPDDPDKWGLAEWKPA